MKMRSSGLWLATAVLLGLCAPARAAVHMVALRPTLASPQSIGATVGWTATATDTNVGPLTFQFSVAPPGGAFMMTRNFNVGTLSGGTWKSLAYPWAVTGSDGTYQVQVVAKDFTSGESDSMTVSFVVTSPVTGTTPVVLSTKNPLVALFIAPSCAAGNTIRVSFRPQTGSTPATTTNWTDCQPSSSNTFEIAGMYPKTTYSIHAQVNNRGTIINKQAVSFKTGALPAKVPIPTFQAGIQDGPGDPNQVLLHGLFDVRQNLNLPAVATDLSGNVIWYYYANDQNHTSMTLRAFPTGILASQWGPAWNPGVQTYQVLRQIDWAGNIVRETNIGILQQQLLALGNPDAAPCNSIPSPPPVGAACVGIFHHDAIETLPNGYTAVLVDVEKIFPAGTQGDTSGLPVDIMGDMVVVLDQNWNAVWYWDAFNPNGGGNGYPQLPVSRTAVLGETCEAGCLIEFLVGNGVAPRAYDWLHSNSLYYWPHDGAPAPSTAPGDLIWSARHQDWVFKIDYKDGAGTGNILWRMGPSGDFTFDNTYNDPWPWFSHQHEAAIENGGAGPFTVLDNGNTRRSSPGKSTGGVPGLGTKCGPHDCDTRGMALTIDENTMQVTPVMNMDLGYFSDAMGSAQLLADGNYYFLAAIVVNGNVDTGYDIQVQPTPGTATGTEVMSVSGPASYRTWLMPNLYSPPTT
ncbi:MAG TPA: aryl-sulfate sulfotransferase [Bryobacteraceae bacterium]|nr:aryl-sulfate sulfotransferase [Bryobacteraceae bacterium]